MIRRTGEDTRILMNPVNSNPRTTAGPRTLLLRADPRYVFVIAVIAVIAATQLPLINRDTYAADAAAPIAPATRPAKLETGLIVSFSRSADGSTATVDARSARLAALYVPAGSPASPFLPPGPFRATFTGVITSNIKDDRAFAAEGRGDLLVTVNDAVVLDLHGELADHPGPFIKLLKGRNQLSITYTAPAEGDAVFRLLWADRDHPFDPVPPTVLGNDPRAPAVAAHADVRSGRELVGSMRCLNCHTGGDTSMVSTAMPELQQDAPNLAALGERLRPEWTAYWITNPRALRTNATMPRVLHGQLSTAADAPSVDARALDIAAFLTKNSSGNEQTASIDPDVAARGARLFTSLGCIACHVPPSSADADASLGRISLQFVKVKFRPGALADFLAKPEAHYAWVRMPNFKLSGEEATALSTFLMARAKDNALPPVTLPPGDAARGKALFESTGCLSCHATELGAPLRLPTASDLTKADWKRGCAADDAPAIGSGVDFGLSTGQRQSLRAFAADGWVSLSRDPAPDFAARQMSALRCNACHSIDDRDNVWANLDDEIARVEQDLPAPAPGAPGEADEQKTADQSRPPLTWVGEKLRPQWMTAFMAGEIPYKPRQWLTSRMPAFPARARLLAEGLALSHGRPTVEATGPPIDAKLAEIGKPLTSRTGFSCISCHGVGEQPPLAAFEAPSINFAHISDRMRHDFFTRWIRRPQYYLPGTKMPQFSDLTGKTAYKTILNGDAGAQFEAIWQYLRAGEQITPPQ